MTGRLPTAAALVLTVISSISAALARDWKLSQAIAKREAALATQLPTITELLALAVGAGESPLRSEERRVGKECGRQGSEAALRGTHKVRGRRGEVGGVA